MNHGVSSTNLRRRGKAPNGGQWVLKRQSEAAAIENKDYDNRFFLRQGYCSLRICSVRANSQKVNRLLGDDEGK
jgi:hypothetical protein